MAEYLIQDTTLDAIADAINAKTGGSSAMTPAQMVTAIAAIPSGGLPSQIVKITTGTFVLTEPTQNYTITHNLGGYGNTVVFVYNSYSFADSYYQRNKDTVLAYLFRNFPSLWQFSRYSSYYQNTGGVFAVSDSLMAISNYNANSFKITSTLPSEIVIDNEGTLETVQWKWIAVRFNL